MGKIQKKYEKGSAASYISRTQALKKLQLSLKDFRRLCILKGIFPHEPRHKKKVNKGGLQNKTWYYVKDINFLAHEPIINKFRDYKVYMRKLRKAISKREGSTARRLRENRPTYTVDHIVRERYPTFTDAVRDLDDGLCMIFLFARLPRSKTVPASTTQMCRRLSSQFLLYIIESGGLRKVFVSVKGVYYQADVAGALVTWIVPHDRCLQTITDVDFGIMSTFLEFYVCMLGFVNFKLYSNGGLVYPPKLAMAGVEEEDTDAQTECVYALSGPLEKFSEQESVPDEFTQQGVNEEEERVERVSSLLRDCKVFLSREVPRESLAFVIRCLGGQVSWDSMDGYGATFAETDHSITHQIVDRPSLQWKQPARVYVQPQWIYDSLNAGMLLPVEEYYPGTVLPAHLSPFVHEAQDDYVPPEKLRLLQLRGEDVSVMLDSDPSEPNPTNGTKKEPDETSKTMRVKEGRMMAPNAHKTRADQAEEQKLQEMLIAKKHRRAYQKIKFGQKRKAKEVRKLKEKRRIYDDSEKSDQ